MVRSNLIPKCHVAPKYITIDHFIFGPDLEVIGGETVGQKIDRVETDFVAINRNYLRLQKFVILVANVMFIFKKPF